jgi:hypothetical protein
MIVTTCGAEGALGAFGGATGFFGDGAGVWALITAPLNSALTNITADKKFLTFIAFTTCVQSSAFRLLL